MSPTSHSRTKSTPKTPLYTEIGGTDNIDAELNPEKSAERVSPPVKPGKWDDLAQSLRNCSWDELQERFSEAMDERSDEENALQKETADLLEVCCFLQSPREKFDSSATRADPSSTIGLYCMVTDSGFCR